ncbi:hypothetical protein [Litchfieldia salsa]|uniref:Uncharacterized protein n=1 Tax=Litchfieldia salsa TaxID=930152 RepID=A0A1H0VE65_9BACI|nr:hypothetical protein [Litchfieldia salsa]SDP76740.1 hypothetical protein SAMN05216565_106229 [Litchfieldia salsa]
MSISDSLTEEKLQKILVNVYQKDQELVDVKVSDVIEDIKLQLMSIIEMKE